MAQKRCLRDGAGGKLAVVVIAFGLEQRATLQTSALGLSACKGRTVCATAHGAEAAAVAFYGPYSKKQPSTVTSVRKCRKQVQPSNPRCADSQSGIVARPVEITQGLAFELGVKPGIRSEHVANRRIPSGVAEHQHYDAYR